MNHTILLHSSAGGRSHIGPMLKVAGQLAHQGHAVVYAALDDNLGYAAGTRAISLGSPGLLARDMAELWHRRMGEARGLWAQWAFLSMVREGAPAIYDAEFPALLREARALAPDLIVCDFFSHACKDVAEVLGVPLVVSFQALDWPGVPMPPYMTSGLGYGRLTIASLTDWVGDWPDFLFRLAHVRLLRRALDTTRRKHRVGTGQPLSGLHYGLGVSTAFLGFEPPQHLPANLRVVGPIPSPPVTPLPVDLAQFLDAHRSTLYVGFGSHVQLLVPEIHAILGGVRLAMEQGTIDSVVWGLANTPPSRFPPVPASIRILQWAPQPQVLAHAATRLILTHGGIESAFEAIHAQVPIVCLPFFADQPRNARKLVDAGVAAHIDALTPAALAAVLARVATNASHPLHLRRLRAILDTHRADRLGPSALLSHLHIAQACRPAAPHSPFLGLPPCELLHLLPPSPPTPLPATLALLLPLLLLRTLWRPLQ